MRISILLLVASLLGALGGAYLVGVWAVGLVVVTYSAGLGVYALVREVEEKPVEPASLHTLEAVLDRARRSG